MLKLVGIDMDDTLLRGNKTFEQSRFKQIFNEFIEKGIIIVIASGNSYPRLDEYFSFMDHDELYFAGDNGNFVVKSGKVMNSNKMNYSEMLEVSNLLESMDNYSTIYCDGVHSYSTGISEEYEEYILSYYGNLQLVDSIDEIPLDKIVKIANHSGLPLDETKEFANYITEKFPSFDAVTSGGGWFDVFDINGGKGSAIVAFQEKYGILPEETIVFGDSSNDESMMGVAKYSVAVENADIQLKEIANYEIGSNEDQAVIEILEEYNETNSLAFMNRFESKINVKNK